MQEEKKVNETAEQAEAVATESVAEKECSESQDTCCEKEGRGERKKVKKLEGELEALRRQLEKAEERAAASEDKYMRMLAEYDNFRKRSIKERESCYSDAYADAVNSVLPVLDNLERAAMYSDAEAVAKGLELTLKSFSETFEKLGICEIEAIGKPFDPNLHNAVMHIDDDAYGENEIVDVLQKGYIKGDRVIRYAMVKVAN
ncbi:MAG: nucleotide exchange factor GrpE [Clostridia bacterium]|nr:nucleotide exchange factor GrpE [Clostridia bacterium]